MLMELSDSDGVFSVFCALFCVTKGMQLKLYCRFLILFPIARDFHTDRW